MTQTEIKGCIFLMSQLWSNYKPPNTEMEINALTNTWSKFFSNLSSNEVTGAIMEISADGTEFAPQIGQIYAKCKAKRQAALESRKFSEEYYRNCLSLARILDIEPPSRECNSQELVKWFENEKS